MNWRDFWGHSLVICTIQGVKKNTTDMYLPLFEIFAVFFGTPCTICGVINSYLVVIFIQNFTWNFSCWDRSRNVTIVSQYSIKIWLNWGKGQRGVDLIIGLSLDCLLLIVKHGFYFNCFWQTLHFISLVIAFKELHLIPP